MKPAPESLEQRLTEAFPRLQAHVATRTAEPEDVAQEVMVRALRSAESFDRTRPLWPWLRTVAERVLHDRWRAGQARPRPAGRFEPEAPSTPPGLDQREEINVLLARLRPVEADVLLRFHQAGESVHSIAAALGLPQGTVKSHLSRARKRLAALPSDPESER